MQAGLCCCCLIFQSRISHPTGAHPHPWLCAGVPWGSTPAVGAFSIPCLPAVPCVEARKRHMPWLPLMHFSSSHRSALRQFSSFSVGEREQSTGALINHLFFSEMKACIPAAIAFFPVPHSDAGLGGLIWGQTKHSSSLVLLGQTRA